jgi:amino acid adenylation domain-containing protein
MTDAACVHVWFEQQARRTPDAIAVASMETRLTYRELDARANQLAHRLRAAGIGPDVPVAFCLPRTEASIIAVLGILKAGGCYVPLDPGHPDDRRAWIIADSGARVVLASRDLAPAGTGATVIVLDDEPLAAQPDVPPAVDVAPDHVAYIIYTSGSTGWPKGSPIPHRNVVRLMRSTEPWFQFGATDVWTVFHSFAFDFSVWEVWGALLYGGCAVVVPYVTSRSPEDMLDLICAHGVTVLNQTPSSFRQLMHAATSATGRRRWSALRLRWVIFGGEALDPPSLAPWFERFAEAQPRLVNMYGITETTVHVTYRPLTAADTRSSRSVIGEPISDLALRVLDGELRQVAAGEVGELFVGGAGLARGYLGRPDLTAQRFVPDPFAATPGARLYRSGDLARRLADGELEFLGRADFQIKIRGFRIEAGEIEGALRAHAGVRDVVVIAREDVPGDKRLVAYLVVRDTATPPATDELRAHLRVTLPDYMIPSAFVILAALPLTVNGKLDRAALPRPQVGTGAAVGAPPDGPIEQAVATIACELLELEQVGATQDLFTAGLHSLLVMKLRASIEARFGVLLPLRDLFRDATVRHIAALIGDAQRALLADAPELDALLAEVAGLSDEEIAALLAQEDS